MNFLDMTPVDIKKIIENNYAFVSNFANVPSLRRVRFIIKSGVKEASAESIEAETDSGRIIIYRDIFERLYGKKNNRMLCQSVSHEFWHLFSARFRFYHKLEQVYLGLKELNNLRQRDVKNFIKKINSMGVREIEKSIREFQETVPCWTDIYIHEQAVYDSKKPFIARIRHFEFRGVVEDMFAEAYAGFISGIKNTSVLDCFSGLLEKFIGFSQIQQLKNECHLPLFL